MRLGAILPRGSIYTTIMELGPKNHIGDGLLGPNSIMVVYMDPLGCGIVTLRNPKERYYTWCHQGGEGFIRVSLELKALRMP